MHHILKINSLCIIALLFLEFAASAEMTFSKLIKKGGVGNSIAQTGDGGYILTGNRVNFTAESFVIKLSPSGKPVWKKRFKGISPEGSLSLLELSKITEVSDGFVVAGRSHGLNQGLGSVSLDMLAMKLDSSGNIAWATIIDRGGTDFANCISKTKDGGYILSGFSDYFRDLPSSTLVVKLNSSGSKIWAKAYNFVTEKNSIVQSPDGGYILAGSEAGNSGNLIVMKLNNAGNILWKRVFRVPTFVEFGELIQVKKGGYALTASNSNNQHELSLIVVRFSTAGSVIWNRRFIGGVGDFSSIAETDDGGFVVGTDRDGFGVMLKLDSLGNVEWERDFARSDSTYNDVRSVRTTSDSGYIATGRAFVEGLPSVSIMKLDSLGMGGRCALLKMPTLDVGRQPISVRSTSVQATDPVLEVKTPSLTVINGYPYTIVASCP